MKKINFSEIKQNLHRKLEVLFTNYYIKAFESFK